MRLNKPQKNTKRKLRSIVIKFKKESTNSLTTNEKPKDKETKLSESLKPYKKKSKSLK